MHVQFVSTLHPPGADADTCWHLIGVRAVGEDLGFVLALAQEVDCYLQVTSFPISHAAEVPCITVLSGDGDVLRWHPVQNLGVIPDRGRSLNEFEFGLVLVSLGVVGNHFQRHFINHVHGQLMGAGSSAHGVDIPGPELLLSHVVEAPGV